MTEHAGETTLATKALNRAICALPIGPRRRAAYLRAHHRPLSLSNPVRYSEKVNWRMVNDRRDAIAMACDKLRMKSFVADRIDASRLRIPITLWAGTDVRQLADVDLPPRWVLKPNAGTGQVHFGSGRPDPTALDERAREWLSDRGLARWGEWGYGRAQRVLVAEERVDGSGGGGPDDLWDWKFFVFDGEVRWVTLDTDRQGDHRRRIYTAEWEPLPHRTELPLAPVVPPPAELEEMMTIARELGSGFDHIRVDLYLSRGQLWFGELTPYSGSGMITFEPEDLDFAFGAAWQLPNLSDGFTPARDLSGRASR